MNRESLVRMHKQLARSRQLWLAAGTAVWLGATLAQASVIQTPIALTPGSYTENVVVGTGAGITATMDSGTDLSNSGQTTYYTLGYNGSAPTTGVPMGTTLVSQFDPNTTFQFQPVAAIHNVALLDWQHGLPSTTLTLTTPAAYAQLSFLGASGDPLLHYAINFVGGHSETNSLTIKNWFDSSGPIAMSAEGRVTIGGTFDQVGNPNGTLLFQNNVPVLDQLDPISSVTLFLTGDSNNRTAIFALSGELVPEPSTIVLLALGGLTLRGWHRRRLRRA